MIHGGRSRQSATVVRLPLSADPFQYGFISSMAASTAALILTSTGVATTSWCSSFSSSHAAVAAAPPLSVDSVATCHTSGGAAAAAAPACKMRSSRYDTWHGVHYPSSHAACLSWLGAHLRANVDDGIALGRCEGDGVRHSCCESAGDISQHRQQMLSRKRLRSHCNALPPLMTTACPPRLHPLAGALEGCSAVARHLKSGPSYVQIGNAVQHGHNVIKAHPRAGRLSCCQAPAAAAMPRAARLTSLETNGAAKPISHKCTFISLIHRSRSARLASLDSTDHFCE